MNNQKQKNEDHYNLLGNTPQMPSFKEIAKYKAAGHQLQSEAFYLSYKCIKEWFKNTPSFLALFKAKTSKIKKNGFFEQN